MASTRDDEKLAEAVLLVAELLLDDPAGGALKLNKVLFFADFAHVRTHGHPITGAEYQKLQFSPAPRRLLPVREQLLETGAAELRPENSFGHRQDRLKPLRPANRTLFSAEELAALERAAREVGGQVSPSSTIRHPMSSCESLTSSQKQQSGPGSGSPRPTVSRCSHPWSSTPGCGGTGWSRSCGGRSTTSTSISSATTRRTDAEGGLSSGAGL